jgi:hypothetical protein
MGVAGISMPATLNTVPVASPVGRTVFMGDPQPAVVSRAIAKSKSNTKGRGCGVVDKLLLEHGLWNREQIGMRSSARPDAGCHRR